MLDESLQIDIDAEQRGQEQPKPRRGRKPKVVTPRKPRERKPYEVESKLEGGEVGWIGVANVDDTAAGIDWIAKNGEDAKTYRVVCIMAEKTVKVETREVRTLE